MYAGPLNGSSGCCLAVLAPPQGLWQGGLDELQQTYGSVAAAIAPHALVCVNAAAPLHPGVRQAMLAAGMSEEQFRLFNHPTNDVWCRDHGPRFRPGCEGRFSDAGGLAI